LGFGPRASDLRPRDPNREAVSVVVPEVRGLRPEAHPVQPVIFTVARH
jgi:hypothetical protein